MIFPKFNPKSFWSYDGACDLLGAKYPAAPLGMITLAALLPPSWDIRLVNRNTEELQDGDLAWADDRHDRRHAGPAIRFAEGHRAGSACRQAGRGRRPRPNVEPKDLRTCRYYDARRGREYYRRVHRRLAAWGTHWYIRGAEIPGRRHQDADPALRSAEVQAVFIHRGAV